jgi:hypothetical protein
MTKNQLRKQLGLLALAFAILLAWALTEFYWFGRPSFVANHGTLIAIGFAVYGAHVLQRRGKFIDDLRTWWNEITKAKSQVLTLGDTDKTTQKEFNEAFYSLSNAMDSLRLIFSNI